jgi:hypothetical protein
MDKKRRSRSSLKGYKLNPPRETHSAVDRPVKIPGKTFDEAMELVFHKPKKRKK